MLICDKKNPQDVKKMAGEKEDDVADETRYAIKSYLAAEPSPPASVIAAETYARYEDPNQRAMAMLRLSAEQQSGKYLRRKARP